MDKCFVHSPIAPARGETSEMQNQNDKIKRTSRLATAPDDPDVGMDFSMDQQWQFEESLKSPRLLDPDEATTQPTQPAQLGHSHIKGVLLGQTVHWIRQARVQITR